MSYCNLQVCQRVRASFGIAHVPTPIRCAKIAEAAVDEEVAPAATEAETMAAAVVVLRRARVIPRPY